MSKRLGELFLNFSVLVANSKNLFYYYTVAHPAAHGLLNRGKVNKKESLAAPPTVVVDMYLRCFLAAPLELRTFLEASRSWNIKEMCMHAQAMQPMMSSRSINGPYYMF